MEILVGKINDSQINHDFALLPFRKSEVNEVVLDRVLVEDGEEVRGIVSALMV
jgi:hypothetical protein